MKKIKHTNPDEILKRVGIEGSAESLYVTRTYVTKHGAGRLPYEDIYLNSGKSFADMTNVRNEWQGSLRFAPHGSVEEFNEYVIKDSEGSAFTPSLLLTHVDETSGKVLAKDGDYQVDEWADRINADGLYKRIYISDSHFAEDIREVT